MTRPVLFFAHANGIPGGSYETFLAPLRSDYEVRYVDRIGHDPAWPVRRGWHALSLELERELEHCPRPLTAVGHSMGGILLFLVALRHPAWFRSLVMMEPPLINGPHGLLFGIARGLGLGDRITPAGRSRGRRAHFRDDEDMRSYFGSRALFRAFDPRCLEDYLRAGLEPDGTGGWRLRFDPAVEVEIFRTTPTGLDRRPALQVPGTLFSAEQSSPAARGCARRHARRHGMRFRDAPGSHMFPLEHPETAAALVAESLREQEEAVDASA